MRLVKAITFCVPTTLVRSALSSVGLKVTLPAVLITTSRSSAMLLRFFFAVAQIRFGDVAAETTTLSRMKPSSALPYLLAQRIEWRRRNDVVPETGFGFFLRTSANRDVDAPDVGKAMQQHAQRDLAEKAGAADQENCDGLGRFRLEIISWSSDCPINSEFVVSREAAAGK